jgi:hypothetical protein
MITADRTTREGSTPSPATPAGEPRASAALRRATGRDRAEWFDALDAWGAAGRPYREIADWLTAEHRMSSWWAQKLIVEYEQARGLRAPGVRRGGTFTVGASKTLAVRVERLVAAFADPTQRADWLPGVALRERTSQAGRSIRYDVGDGSTRLNVTFVAAGEGKSQVAVEQELLPDSPAADAAKAYWRGRLSALKSVLEGGA